MNLKKIEEVLSNSALPDKLKEMAIIKIMAEDKNVLITIVGLIDAERRDNEELLKDMNVELSRVFVAYKDPKMNKAKDFKPFVLKNVVDFYLKWQHKIRCCFKVEGLPE